MEDQRKIIDTKLSEYHEMLRNTRKKIKWIVGENEGLKKVIDTLEIINKSQADEIESLRRRINRISKILENIE